MRMGLLSWTRWIAPVLIVLSLSSVGCKSGWKMPGASMLPWSRQPSATTLAGDSATPKLTEGPAANHTPQALASVAAGKSSTSVAATPAGYGTSSPMNVAGARPGVAGAAASSNGYQTGPYGMSSLGAATAPAGANGQPSSTTVPQTSPTAMTGYPSGGYLPNNVYSGTAGLPSASSSSYANTARPQAQPQMHMASTPVQTGYAGGVPPTSSLPPTGYPSASAGSSLQGGAPQSYSMPNAAPNSPYSMPAYQPNAVPGSMNSATQAGYPTPTGSTSLPPHSPSAGGYASPNVTSPSNGSQVPSMQLPSSQIPSSYGASSAGSTSIPTTATGAATQAGFRPGTTARTTNYNFSGAQPTAPQNYSTPTSNAPSMVPPTSVPGPGSAGFQLPPNTANATGPGLTAPVSPTGGTLYR